MLLCSVRRILQAIQMMTPRTLQPAVELHCVVEIRSILATEFQEMYAVVISFLD